MDNVIVIPSFLEVNRLARPISADDVEPTAPCDLPRNTSLADRGTPTDPLPLLP